MKTPDSAACDSLAYTCDYEQERLHIELEAVQADVLSLQEELGETRAALAAARCASAMTTGAALKLADARLEEEQEMTKEKVDAARVRTLHLCQRGRQLTAPAGRSRRRSLPAMPLGTPPREPEAAGGPACTRPPLLPAHGRNDCTGAPAPEGQLGSSAHRDPSPSPSFGSDAASFVDVHELVQQAELLQGDDSGLGAVLCFDGFWVVVGTTGPGKGKVSHWLRSLEIADEYVVTGVGEVVRLTREGGRTFLCGGELLLDGDMLCRVGKSGPMIAYVRHPDDPLSGEQC